MVVFDSNSRMFSLWSERKKINCFRTNQDDDSENGLESSREITVSGTKAPEIDPKWKQYSGPEDHGIIRRLPAISYREEQGFCWNTPENFPARNSASMKFPGTDCFLAVLSDLRNKST